MVGANFFQFIPEEDRESVRNHYRFLTLKRPVVTYEHQVVAPGGEICWQQWTDQALFDEQGKLTEYQSIGEDITHRKRAEEALRDSEKRYRELSITDDLTNLYNSRHFFGQLKTEIEGANRYGNALSLLVLDVDNFKRYNDRFGHMEGDRVLAKIGEVIRGSLRQTDSAYRYGGEEFAIILRETAGQKAAHVAERIREAFEMETFSPEPEERLHMTASIGVAYYVGGEELSAFIKRADANMYMAKKQGKNCVFFSE